MAGKTVAGELYWELDGQLLEIKRQLRQPTGYPFNPEELRQALQNLIEGHFAAHTPTPGGSPVVLTRAVWEKVCDALGCAFDETLWVEPEFGFWDAYVQKGATPNKAVEAMRQAGITIETFGVDLDQETEGRNDRDPAQGAYRIRFRARQEADKEYQNLSANNLKERGIKGATLLERLLLGLAYFLATKGETDLNQRHLDVKNITLGSGSRDSDGSVPNVYWHPDNREVYVDWYDSARGSSDLRCREAIS